MKGCCCMISSAFGELKFKIGWKTDSVMTLFEKDNPIIIKAKAYYEKDGITKEQENSLYEFKNGIEEKSKQVERILNDYFGDCKSRFTPRTLLFERDGSYALLLDDSDNPDDGIAVVLKPEEKVVLQDEYL